MAHRFWGTLILATYLLEAPVFAETPLTQYQLRQQEGKVLQLAQGLAQPDTVPVDPTPVLPDFNVTASRRERPNFETPESLSLFTYEEIQGILPLAQNVTGLLRLVPGVQLGLGTSPLEANVSIRGLGDDRSPVFIDGERQNVGQGEIREDLFSVDPNEIERIEVLRGSASGTYGSDATGGVINIITRQPQANAPFKIGFSNYAGGYATYNQGLNLAFGGEKYALQVGTSYTNQGDALDARGNSIPNQQDYQTYNTKLRYFPDTDNTLTFQYSGYRFHTGLLALSEAPELLASLPLTSKDRFGLDWRSQRIFGSATDLKLSLYYNQLFQNFNQQILDEEDGELLFGNSSAIQVNTVGTNLQLTSPVGQGFVTYGVDFFREEGFNNTLVQAGDDPQRSLPVVPDGRQIGLAGYALLDYPLTPELVVSAGLRYDSFSSTALAVSQFNGTNAAFSGQTIDESAVTPKAGLSWAFAPGLRLRANYSQGFRVPTIKERFNGGFVGPLNAELEDSTGTPLPGACPDGTPLLSRATAILQGNPNLTPERTQSWEVGLGGKQGNQSFDVAYFNTRASGLLNISYASQCTGDGVPLYNVVNIPDVRIQGLEAQAATQLSPEWRLRGAFTWTDAIRTDTQQPLTTVVPTYGTLQVVYRSPGGFSALVQGRLASARPGVSGFGVVDINLDVPLNAQLRLTLSATNLFNSLYRESLVGFNAPGTQFFMGLRTGEQ
ncbi:TonB-dependent receptor [Anthocerotibacter panamensis]|uniref:TonB-dependent receptor n=1 Tax=Anthocerotibacter panamensis TaxID=2857077 RepID=UPI001C407884|nr:TonB-dependent receptor [Anthocerotibacter panamensis]